MTRNITITNRKGDKICEFSISTEATVESLKKQFIQDYLKTKRRPTDINRIRLTVGVGGVALADNKKSIRENLQNELTDQGDLTLVYKDLGPQISWTVVFLVEYFGPILIIALLVFWYKGGNIAEYSQIQRLGIFMVVIHYLKREVETIFVHRFSNETMPFTNIFKNSFHYWILFGIGSWQLLKDGYEPTQAYVNNPTIVYVLVAVFSVAEFFNLMCHITLRNLRKPGTKERGIPQGWGFQLVSCANYWWESVSWLTYAVLVNTIFGYVFWVVSTAQMLQWAIKKHKRYRKDFKDYPRRKVMIPFVI